MDRTVKMMLNRFHSGCTSGELMPKGLTKRERYRLHKLFIEELSLCSDEIIMHGTGELYDIPIRVR